MGGSCVVSTVIDRRVEVLDGSADQRASTRRVSDLRPLPFVVLLGEPGIGKSTVLGIEAAHEQVPVLKVREFVTGAHPEPDATLFLDALDEYRTDGQPADKVYNLADAIAEANVLRWRLSCRSEDWRKEADIAPIQRTTAGAAIVVAQILPLDNIEAAAVLATLGEDDPEAFLAKAETLGAGGFVESPLSLKLLHKAVADGGTWPSTRYELFASAIRRLAYERNKEHKWGDRRPLDDIIAAAGRVCLLLLVSGVRAIWRSNDEPPTTSADNRAHLPAHDLQLDRALLNDMLDTALFRGEGEAFEPMHRTVAEYLAGQALARAAVGTAGRAALPLSRAMALITGAGGGPPTELRGLYAWFAAHLAKLGDNTGVMRLIEVDAVTVLTYGDAAVFDTPARRSILTNLTRHDPYFRASEIGVTAVGGLAGEDLTGDFAAILTEPPDRTHRLMTVLEVLTSGPPVTALGPLLRGIALDPARPEWHRWRAADAWLNGVDNPASARRELLSVLAGEPVSIAREALRAHLAAALPTSALSVPEIKSVLADYQRLPEDKTIGRLFGLQRKLESEPRAELFDEPINTWLSDFTKSQNGIEVEQMIDYVLAASIRRTADLTAARLWRWTVNVRDDVWSNLRDESGKALVEWLDRSAGRDVAFFEAILASDDPDTGPSVPGTSYMVAAGRRPSPAIIRRVLSRATESSAKAAAKRLLEIAVAMAHHPETDTECYWETYDRVASQPGCKRLLKLLTIVPIKPWRREQHKRAEMRKRKETRQRADNIKVLAPVLAEIRVGSRPGPLDWAARLYFGRAGRKCDQPTGIERIAYFTDKDTTDAILAGWEYVATKDLVGVDATLLGRAEAESRRYYVEWPAVAGLDRLFEEGRPPDQSATPIAVAIAVLKSAWIIEDNKRRSRLERWAVERLNFKPAAGAAQLLEFWDAALDAGATQLNSIWRLSEDDVCTGAIEKAIDALLDTHRSMPPDALRSALHVAAKCLDSRRLLAIAEASLADTAVAGAQQRIWSFVAFALDPIGHGDRFLKEHSGAAVGLFSEDLTEALIDAFGGIDGGSRPYREAMIVRLLGPVSSPDFELWNVGDLPATRRSDTVRHAINWLAGQTDRDAGVALASLVDDPALIAWQPSLRHAQAQQTRLRRDRAFKHPAPTTVRAAMAGGPPVNASDVRAVVMEELGRLRAELRTSDSTPWKRYWNVDSTGKVTTPLVENECRDHLLERLRDRLQRYQIVAAIPEARRGERTRADMLILTGAGRNLPVEAKRHYHAEIWQAASSQLQGYAAEEGADGFGIYLVFWFGNDVEPTPARPDGTDGPMSAVDLEAMLASDLPLDLRARTDVIVFDVSNSQAPATAKPRKKRTAKAKASVPTA